MHTNPLGDPLTVDESTEAAVIDEYELASLR
jgi:hypothetical protein